MTFRIFVMIFGVAIVIWIFKYWDQPLIEKSMLSSYQKFKSNFLSGIGQNIYVTSEKFAEENQALRKEISLLNKINIKNNSHIMELLQNLTVKYKNPTKNIKKDEKASITK